MKIWIKSSRICFALILTALLFVSLVPSAAAQDDLCESGAPFIEYGDTIDGEIDDDAPALAFCFEGEEGDEVAITMETIDGDLEPIIIVTDSTLQSEIASSDEGSEDEPAVLEFTLPDDGPFVIIAARVGFNRGRSEGEFELTLELVGQGGGSSGSSRQAAGATCDTLDLGVDINGIAYNETVEGEITDDDYAIFYCFNGLEDDEIVITMTTTDGDLDTLVLLTPDGDEILGVNDDIDTEGGVLDSELSFTLPEDGVYLIVATRYNTEVGDTEGEYELTLTLIDGPSTELPEETPTPTATATPEEAQLEPTPQEAQTAAATCEAVTFTDVEVTPIGYGNTVEGEITDEAFARIYCFEGAAGDAITISMTGLGGELDTYLLLSDTALEQTFTSNDDRSGRTTDSEINFTLPEDGAYLIVATRFNNQVGDSEGAYELTLTLNDQAQADEPPPATTPPPTSTPTPADQAETEEATEASICAGIADIDITGVDEIPLLTYGGRATGEITNDTPMQFYCFEGEEGDEVVINVGALDGDLDTYLMLTDTTLEITFAENDDISRRNTDSEIVFTLPEDGVYVIVVSRFQLADGDSEGSFDLTLELGGDGK